MKTLFGLFISITITYVIAEETTPDFGPFEDTTAPDFGPFEDTTLPDFGPFEDTTPPDFGPFEDTIPPDFGPFGPYEWRAFQQRVRQMISMIEIRLLFISHQMKNSPQSRALEKTQIEKEMKTIDELKAIIKKFSGAPNLDFIQKLFIYTSEGLVLKSRRALTQLILESKQF